MHLTFDAISEERPGAKWQQLFARHWAAYRRWYLSEGDEARPTYLAALRMLRKHMPELLPTYERLVELAGGGDVAARFLTLYRPPPYLSGCSQAVWPGEEPVLVRNYDYSPQLFEGTLLHSAWNGRQVIAVGDCLVGVLDGINDAGLSVSLTFGGRRVVGDGFGVPLVLRYILEFCETTAEAAEVLRRVPTHMSYNVTVLDRRGEFKTAFLAPDRPAVLRQFPVATNHQGQIEWHQHARATATLERERFLFFRFADSEETEDGFTTSFLHSPLYSLAYTNGFGTLYTAVYRPHAGCAEYRWPDTSWLQSFARFEEGSRAVDLGNRAVRATPVQ